MSWQGCLRLAPLPGNRVHCCSTKLRSQTKSFYDLSTCLSFAISLQKPALCTAGLPAAEVTGTRAFQKSAGGIAREVHICFSRTTGCIHKFNHPQPGCKLQLSQFWEDKCHGGALCSITGKTSRMSHRLPAPSITGPGPPGCGSGLRRHCHWGLERGAQTREPDDGRARFPQLPVLGSQSPS
jgi:hypothetical protein